MSQGAGVEKAVSGQDFDDWPGQGIIASFDTESIARRVRAAGMPVVAVGGGGGGAFDAASGIPYVEMHERDARGPWMSKGDVANLVLHGSAGRNIAFSICENASARVPPSLVLELWQSRQLTASSGRNASWNGTERSGAVP